MTFLRDKVRSGGDIQPVQQLANVGLGTQSTLQHKCELLQNTMHANCAPIGQQKDIVKLGVHLWSGLLQTKTKTCHAAGGRNSHRMSSHCK